MKRLSPILGSVIFAAAAMFVLATVADEPPARAPEMEDSEVAEPDKPISAAEQKFRDAVRGQPVGPVDDGILEDVLDVIRKRGSGVLGGSSLDPRNEDAFLLDALPTASRAAEPDAFDPDSDHPITRVNGTSPEKPRAAELLLKASRVLEKVGPPSHERAELIRRMRAEAKKLLAE